MSDLQTLSYRPRDAHVGDVIPFFWRGHYHLFYLRSPEAGTTRDLDWAHIASDDLLHWQELPPAVVRGGPGEPDHGGIWTGSVIERRGVFHIYYTGWAPDAPTPQTVCHATSDDLLHWRKDPANPILTPDGRWYETGDWRDPFVFWNDAEGRYWMLITSRDRHSDWPRRGCIALATSPDLVEWQVHPPLWRPELVYAPECPDYWHEDGRWTLLYSTRETRLRHAPQPGGPWAAPTLESVDGPHFYAAKTLHDGRRRLLFGWVALRDGESDTGAWRWGGHLGLPRELRFDAQGDALTRPAPEVQAAFKRVIISPESAAAAAAGMAGWRVERNTLCADAGAGASHLRLDELPTHCRITCRLKVDRPAARVGLLLRMSAAADAGYTLLLEADRDQLALRPWDTWGDPPPLLDRPLAVRSGQWVDLDVYLQDSIIEAFAGGRVALTGRLYARRDGWLGVLAQNGAAHISGLTVRALP